MSNPSSPTHGQARTAVPDRSASPVASPARPGLADWLDLLALLRFDEGAPDTELRRRDRAIGAALDLRADTDADIKRPERWLVAWVRTLRRDGSGFEGTGSVAGVRTAEAVAWGAALLGFAGLVFGSTAALGAFAFQPQGRINVVAVIAVLVVLPALFLCLALFNALPARLRGMLPLIGSEPEGGGLLQPARWALRLLPQAARDALDLAWARGQSLERLSAPVQRWLLLSASQGAAVAFQLGALATALGLVVFSDLSFGWSTTLSIGANTAHGITTALSVPWAWLWPEAVPSVELIERTRFFRIAAELDPGVKPEFFGGWWRFLLLSMGVYGLLPRLCFFVFARVRLRRGLVRAMVDAPGARRVLARMQTPLVETAGVGGDEAGAAAAADAGTFEAQGGAARDWPVAAVVISWAEALEQADAVVALWTSGEPEVLSAGGRRTPSDDRRTVEEAAALASGRSLPIAVVVRGFEPPVLEIVDFLAALRRAVGDGLEIVVGLVGGGDAHRLAWQRKLARAGDPWLSCLVYSAATDATSATDANEGEGT